MHALDSPASSGRLLSLDFFRGATMFLLVAEFTMLFEHLVDPPFAGTWVESVFTQFHHHPWNGLRFWDLVQPYFMFIVGVAIPFSVAKRRERGQSERDIRRHAIRRALLLLLIGWALYCIDPGRITFRFQNVLAQLSVTYTVAFLLMNRSWRTQIAWSVAFIAVAELCYRVFWVAGFDQPFTPDHNFGAWFDLLISGELSSGHWVSFNAIPTTAHTIWGVVVGQLLRSDRSERDKLRPLLIAGVLLLIAGYGLDPVTPIVKRISTSSFVLASGGWCILTLALCYWIIDVRGFRSWVSPFAIVGMNPLFIYVFAHVGGADLVTKIVRPFTMGLLGWINETAAVVVTSLVVLALLWGLCGWLHRRRIYIRI
jgi:predicted acyltransferase